MHVILTVPHATCPDKRHEGIGLHVCDYKAKEFAEALQQALVKRGVTVTLLIANVNRRECDINKPECRTMSFRPKLTKLYCRYKDDRNETWVIDVHSSPVKEHSKRNYFAFLDIVPKKEDIPPKVRHLIDKLKENVTATKTLRGTIDNDILLEAREWGYYNSTLLEVNEDIPDTVMKRGISTIVDYICGPPQEGCVIV